MIKPKAFHSSKGLILKKTLFLTITCFLLSISLYSQQNDLVLKAEELVYSNPNEAVKIADHLLSISREPQEIAIANLLLTKGYLTNGDLKKAIIYAFEVANKLDKVPVETQVENTIIKATLLRELYLDTQSLEYLNKATMLTSSMTSEKEHFEFRILLEHINLLLDRLDTAVAIADLKDVKIQFKNLLKTNLDERRAYYFAKARAFNSINQYDSAFVYMDKTFDLINASKKNNLYEKALIYKESGLLFLKNKEFRKSKEALFIGLQFAEILDNSFLLEQINRDLAINYIATNQKSEHKVYYEKFLFLNNSVEEIEEGAVNTYFNIISDHEKNQLHDYDQKYEKQLYSALIGALSIFIIGFLIIFKSENRKKRLREILNYLELSRNFYSKVKPSIPLVKQRTKRLFIPEETEQNIILKLKRFEKSLKYLNKDMSLALLAGQFETNTKYLSEVINKNYNDNFNTFINKLRINYIIEKLKNDTNYINYKISFLADESGFSSHSNFTTVFKGIVGMSPVTFINLLKEEREEIIKNKKT